MSKNLIPFKVTIALANGAVMENTIGATSIFGAVKFVQDESAKNGWFVVALECHAFTDQDAEESGAKQTELPL